jgi:hypothetical protein
MTLSIRLEATMDYPPQWMLNASIPLPGADLNTGWTCDDLVTTCPRLNEAARMRPLLNGAQKQKQKSFFVFVFGNGDLNGPKTKIQVDPIFGRPQKSKNSTKTSSVLVEFFSTKTKTKTVLTFSTNLS